MAVLAAWAGEQLAEFLAAVTTCPDRPSALARAVERAAEALDSEIAVLLDETGVTASVGFVRGKVPVADIVRVAAGDAGPDAFGFPAGAMLRVPLDDDRGTTFLLVRCGGEPYATEERHLVHAMGRVLSLALRMQDMLDSQRRLNGELLERERLLERLSRIQRSISHRQPLQEVLDAVTQAARDLLSTEVNAIRLIDPDRPGYLVVASAIGVDEDTLEEVRHSPLSDGVGGQAVLENRLVVYDDYARGEHPHPTFQRDQLHTAMAAPVHEEGQPTGSLVVATYDQGRCFTSGEHDLLRALAEHASLALTDARAVEAMREAQRSKDLFLAMVSHELKTPLTVIMGSLRTIQQHGDHLSSATRAELFETSYSRCLQLEQLIDRLLKGARAELAGERRSVLLTRLVAEAVRGFGAAHRLRVDSIPTSVVTVDVGAVTGVIGVLLENAVAHAPEHSEIVLRATHDSGQVAITVTNEGALPTGVDRRTLFEPFHRGAAARSSGVGLGLYIAARLAESVGGHMTAEDDEGGSVTFGLLLPVASVGSSTHVPEPRDDGYASEEGNSPTWPSPEWTTAASKTG